MLTDFRTLSGETRIGEAGRLLLAGTQRDFPVVDSAGRLIGVLIHTDLFRALREQGEDAQVAEVMRKELELLQVDESLDAALSRASVERSAIMPVFQGANMVGLLTPENLGEYMMIRSALARRRATPPPLPVPGRRVPPVIPPPLLWKPNAENRAG
jgi:stage IV sporulation protein FB